MPAPIVIFAFNRPDALKSMLESLKANALYGESVKIFFIDGPRGDFEDDKVKEVTSIAEAESQHVFVAERNQGLAQNIINGVTQVINQYGKAIVIEDDLYLAPLFLTYMNQALERYADDKRIISVCGYGLKVKRPMGYTGDVYLSNRSSSWGWATWANRWREVDWNVENWDKLKADPAVRRGFNRGGSDMFGMLTDYMERRNNSWAIRFCFTQYLRKTYSVHPFLSLVENEGFGAAATNCKQKYSRFKTQMDIRTDSRATFELPADLMPDERILKKLRHYHSITLRIYSKIRKLLNI